MIRPTKGVATTAGRELFVIARNSSFTDKGKVTKVQEIGRSLGVGFSLV